MINEIINTKHKELIEKELNNTQNIVKTLSSYIKNGSDESEGITFLLELTKLTLNKKIPTENYINIIQEVYKVKTMF